MRFIYQPQLNKTVMHIERQNPQGEGLGVPLCGKQLSKPRTVGVNLGKKLCPLCDAAANPEFQQE